MSINRQIKLQKKNLKLLYKIIKKSKNKGCVNII